MTGKATRTGGWLTVADILAELGISRRTWQEWREKGVTPKCKRLPNGQLRISARSYEKWLDSLDEVAA